MKKLSKISALFLIIAVFLISGAACGPKTGSGSPELVSVNTWGGCTGGEDDQFIKADLEFSDAVKASDKAAEQLRVTIGGDRVKSDDIKISSADEKTIEIEIPVDKVTSGVLEIKPLSEGKLTAITDESGEYAVKSFSVKKIVPSGMEITTVSSDEGSVSAQVTALANHRSITWIKITAGGNTVKPAGTGTDIMDDAVAVHEHDFLWATEESTAADIAEAVNKYYSGQLTASSSGDIVTVSAAEGGSAGGVLDISIYTY
ncbi:MAG: hypothetical protein ACOYJI_00985 [Anaerovoracaceae bacterium]|jgi:hypothetical protein